MIASAIDSSSVVSAPRKLPPVCPNSTPLPPSPLATPAPLFPLIFHPWTPPRTWFTILGTSTPSTTLAPTPMPHSPGLLVCLSSLTQDPRHANAAPRPPLPCPLFPGPIFRLWVTSLTAPALPTEQPQPISPVSQSAPVLTPHTSMQLPCLLCSPGMNILTGRLPADQERTPTMLVFTGTPPGCSQPCLPVLSTDPTFQLATPPPPPFQNPTIPQDKALLSQPMLPAWHCCPRTSQ